MSDEVVDVRLEVSRDGKWADVYAQAGPSFPSYADETWVGDAPMKLLKKRTRIEGDRATVPLGVFRLIRRLSRKGWPGKHD